jgi:murein DD-endopeptidase MepM/ murein hydrolase activator NlpD
MAPVITPIKSFTNINTSMRSLRSGLGGIKTKTVKLNNILLKKTKVKRESIARNYILSQRRQESERRKNREDIIEASSIGGVFKRQAKAIASSTKGFLGRIMDFLGTLLVGWLMYNLPSIITMAQELISRIQRLYTIVTGFFNNTVKIFRGFGNVLGAIGKNILTFDFTDSNKRVENAMKDLNTNFDDMQSQFDEGFRLLTTSLGEGVASGVDAKPTGTQYPNQSMQESSGGLPGSESPEMYRIAAALSTEGSGAQSTVDMMQVVVNRKASGKYGSSYTEILSGPNQFEGVEKKGVGGFKKIQTLRDASKWSGQSEATLLGIIKNIQDPSLQKSSAQYVGGAFEFRAAPQYYLKNGLVPGEMGPDGRFYGSGWRGGSGDNQFLKDPIRDKSRINPAGPASFNLPKPAQTSTAQTSTAVVDQFKGKPGGASGQITDVFGYSASRRRNHNGIDIAPAGPGYFVALKLSGTVDYIGFDSGGYGNFVDIKSENTIYRFAHLAKVFVKRGQPYNGQTIGEIGTTGGSTGIHLHFEVRPNGKPIDPRPYLGLLSIGKGTQAITGAPLSLAQIASPTITTPQQLSQQRNGPTIVVIEEDPPAQQQVSAGGGGGGGMIPIIINPLNSFITKKLLLDLAYT